MKRSFYKMQALGNDFVILDNRSGELTLSKLHFPTLSHRHLGIGFDQLLVIEQDATADFLCRIFNADGSEAEQCGNGLRCFAKLVYDLHFIANRSFSIKTLAGTFAAQVLVDGNVEVMLGAPIFDAPKIPFITHEPGPRYRLNLNTAPIDLTVLSMGNPHAVLEVDSLQAPTIAAIGNELSHHASFPQGVNIGFMQVVDRHRILLRTFERGVGETYACGSNACASVVAGILNGTLDTKVTVQLPLGELIIEWPDKTTDVKMTGPAHWVFEGIIEI